MHFTMAVGARRIVVDAPLDLGAEMPDQALDRPGGGVAQGTDGVAFDLLGDFLQQVDLRNLGVALHHGARNESGGGKAVETPRANCEWFLTRPFLWEELAGGCLAAA